MECEPELEAVRFISVAHISDRKIFGMAAYTGRHTPV